MSKRVIAVYDLEENYGDRFAEFVNQKKQIPFEVLAFTSMEHLKEYADNRKIDLILIGCEIDMEEVKRLGAAQIIVLAEGAMSADKEPYSCVYKYQSADNIIREVMDCYCAAADREEGQLLGKKSYVAAVYSPVSRCLKTSLALTMGRLLSRDGKVLFISLEDCSGLSRLMGQEPSADLSDLLYFFSQGIYSRARLAAVIHTWEDMDYIPPVKYPEDLCQISSGQIAKLLDRIAKDSPYETIIADLGHMGKRGTDILQVCDVIYMPLKDDCVSAAKVEEFEDYLENSGQAPLKERIKKLKLPYYRGSGRRETYLEQLLWGELGDYTRQLMRGTEM